MNRVQSGARLASTQRLVFASRALDRERSDLARQATRRVLGRNQPLETQPTADKLAGMPDHRLSAERSRFPDPRGADPDGLVAIGGRLDPPWLLDAYRHGIFPWPSSDVEPMLWWSPDPRAVMPLDGMRISKRLRRTIRNGRFEVTVDEDFSAVLTGCATGPGRQGGTWITDEMRTAYVRMHQLGHAHSVEAWTINGDVRRLAGGVYGLAMGGVFAAESMFHYETDASKVALASLVTHLGIRGYQLMDIQQWTDHTGSLGAVEMSREDYLTRLTHAIDLPVTFGERLESSAPE